MFLAQEKMRMTKDEMRQLLKMRGWSKADLANYLDVSENVVYQWFSGRRNPGGPANILMRMWLTEAKSKAVRPKKEMVLNGR